MDKLMMENIALHLKFLNVLTVIKVFLSHVIKLCSFVHSVRVIAIIIVIKMERQIHDKNFNCQISHVRSNWYLTRQSLCELR